jgi:prephenate dehydrogenase
MQVLIIDGQGGRIGRQLVERIRAAALPVEITAVGTNSTATAAMLKGGADQAATGENAVVVCSRSAEVIIGPVGIVIADALLGEITEKMAVAVGRSSAKKLLLPVNLCGNTVVGVPDVSISALLNSTLEHLQAML